MGPIRPKTTALIFGRNSARLNELSASGIQHVIRLLRNAARRLATSPDRDARAENVSPEVQERMRLLLASGF